MLNPTERSVFIELLDGLAQSLSNAGCNDIKVPDTDEGRALIRESWIHSVDETEVPDNLGCTGDDTMVLALLRKKLNLETA